MIDAVESFFARMMEESNIKDARGRSDATYEHRFLIKQKNLVNMIVDRVLQAREEAGLPPASKTSIANIVKTRVWHQVYSEANVRRAFRKYFGSTGKSGGIFVSKGRGGSIQVTFHRGKYAETYTKATGERTNIPKTNMAMKDLWFDAISAIKDEMGKKRGLGFTTQGGQFQHIPESFTSPGHPGARLHGDTAMKGGFQTTIAKQVLAEGGGEGVGYDDAVSNFARNFNEDYPGEDWLMDQAITKVFNPIKKKYYVKDIQDFTSSTNTRSISVYVEYGDQALNSEMNWADADGIKRAARDEVNAFLRFLNTNRDEVAEQGGALKGSDSFNTKIEKIAKTKVLEAILKNVKVGSTNPDFRLKINKTLLNAGKKAKGKKSNKGNFNLNEALKKVVVAKQSAKLQKVRKQKAERGKGRVDQKAGTNPLALRNMLNELLPVAVAQNMTSPALNYRTGRFANSVRVTNVTQGARGGNTMIEATYMTNPYETFAPGGDKYTPQRNPEKLIRKSLREIATGMIGTKFGVTIN